MATSRGGREMLGKGNCSRAQVTIEFEWSQHQRGGFRPEEQAALPCRWSRRSHGRSFGTSRRNREETKSPACFQLHGFQHPLGRQWAVRVASQPSSIL